MQSIDSNEAMPARRKLLGSIASGAALLGLSAAGAAASPTTKTAAATPPPVPEPAAPEELLAQARLRNYKTRRSSSWDRTGGNNDAVRWKAASRRRCLK